MTALFDRYLSLVSSVTVEVIKCKRYLVDSVRIIFSISIYLFIIKQDISPYNM